MSMPAPEVKPTHTFVYKTVGSATGGKAAEIGADVYLPKTATKDKRLPIFLWFHGGGLLMSYKGGIGNHLRRAAEKYGWCVVSADYRLAPQVALPDIVDDIRDCGKWTRETLPGLVADQYTLDPDNLIAAGGSAGGYLALLSAHPSLGISPPPKALVALYPITNPLGEFFTTPQRPYPGYNGYGGQMITDEEMAPHLNLEGQVLTEYAITRPQLAGERGLIYYYMVQEALLAKLLSAKAPGLNWDDFTPAKFLTKASPPIWVFHGADDIAVGIEQARSLVSALKEKDVDVIYEEKEQAQHLFDQLDATEEMQSMYDFALSHFK